MRPPATVKRMVCREQDLAKRERIVGNLVRSTKYESFYRILSLSTTTHHASTLESMVGDRR